MVRRDSEPVALCASGRKAAHHRAPHLAPRRSCRIFKKPRKSFTISLNRSP